MSYEHIAKVFIKMCDTSGGPVNLFDLSNACSIWKRCKVFNVRPFVLKNVRQCRNDFYAHNDKLLVDNNDKARTFDALRDLLRDKDVQTFINAQTCLNELAKIEKGDKLTAALTEIGKEMKNISLAGEEASKVLDEITKSLTVAKTDSALLQQGQENLIESVEKNRNVLENISKSIDEVKRDTKLLKYNQDELTKDQQRTQDTATVLYERHCRDRSEMDIFKDATERGIHTLTDRGIETSVLLYTILVAVLCVSALPMMGWYAFELFHFPLNILTVNFPPKLPFDVYSGCLSEDYRYPFRQDLPLLGYLPTQSKVVGRQWVFDILEQKLITLNTHSRGELMIADFGFGKSAVIAHLLCAHSGDKGSNLKKHIVAFHVCKYNVASTRSPVRFIRRMVGFMSMKSAEYGQYITLHENSILFNQTVCEEDLTACFDQAITIPLDKITKPTDIPWIVVIDALDECLGPGGDNPILNLLSDRLPYVQQSGQKWMKWFITSRQMSSLKVLDKLDSMKFKATDTRNTDDIFQFILSNVPESESYIRLARTFAYSSEGCMLYAKLALEYAYHSNTLNLPDILKLPVTMDEIYELNFDRLFKGNDNFLYAKPILELISMRTDLKADDIVSIITANQISDDTYLEMVMDKLSFFIERDYYVAFRHRSLQHWLTNGRTLNYKISVEHGHAMVVNYLLNFLPECKSDIICQEYESYPEAVYIWTLAYHTVESADVGLIHKFKSNNFSGCSATKLLLKEYYGLVTFISKRPEFPLKMFDIVLEVISKLYEGDIDNEIAEYIYDISGHNVDLFKFLFEKIAHTKNHFPLLHGAAARCNEVFARYLIDEGNVTLALTDKYGLRAIDKACGAECIGVIELIADKDESLFDMQCLLHAHSFQEDSSHTILNSIDSDFNCNNEMLKNEEMAIDLVTMRNYVTKGVYEGSLMFYKFMAFCRYTFLHVIVYRHSEAYRKILLSKKCDVRELPYCSKIVDISVASYFKQKPHSEGQIPFELDSQSHRVLEDDNQYGRKSIKVFMLLARECEEMLSSSDVQGFTPALLSVALNKQDLFSVVLGQAIQDRCQPVSPLRLYMFWYVIHRQYCVLHTDFPHYRWCWYYTKYSCPTYASLEHLLMRYERARLIDLVIANGYTLDWSKMDANGRTPLDYEYATPEFIHQLELHFGVDIQTLSEKDHLLRLCQWNWSFCFPFNFMCAGTVIATGMCICVYHSILHILYSMLSRRESMRHMTM